MSYCCSFRFQILTFPMASPTQKSQIKEDLTRFLLAGLSNMTAAASEFNLILTEDILLLYPHTYSDTVITLADFYILLFISVTNPIDVIKIRMQLDNELAQTKGDVTVALKYVCIRVDIDKM